MHTFEINFWKIIRVSGVMILLLSTTAYSMSKLKFNSIYQADTIDNVSMMFMVKHGQPNEFNIKNHPAFKSSINAFLFSTTTDLPAGMLLSGEGIITWSPTVDQFNQLKEQPFKLDFKAHSTTGNFITGQIRIIGQGELIVEPSTSQVKTDSSYSVPENVVETDNPVSTPVYQPINILLPDVDNWDTKNEGESFSFKVKATGGSGDYKFELLNPVHLMESLDPYGTFSWTPDYDEVTADELIKSIRLQIKVFDTEGNDAYATVPIFVKHVNRPPVVSELPTFYIQYNSNNTYQLKKEGLTYDPDGDSIIFNPVLKELPQGMSLNKHGEISWKPSTRQFNFLGSNPIFLSFTVEDYPEGAKSIGQIKIEVSQADVPPQITIIPNKDKFELKENEELQLNFFISDPNGEDDLLSFDFVTENSSINDEALVKKENWQYEFSWTPGYDFIKEANEKHEFDISFFAIDKESNRSEKNILVTVEDTENLVEKDRILYDQYRSVLERAFDMISQLNDKEKELEKKYKNAKKGKKNRAISTASLGALTGLSPVIFLENPDGQKIAAGLGGTATATIGTLEASSVIGEPPSDIMRDLNYVSQKRNDLLVYGNVFASKYALPISKRESGFQSDLRSLSIHLNLKEIAQLDLDAAWENDKPATSRNIKKVFKDFNPDRRFENNYKSP